MILFQRRKPDIVILRAVIGDAGEISAVHRLSFRRGWSDGEIATMLDSHRYAIWVARRRGGRGGLLGFAIVRSAGGEAEIITLATTPKARRKGVGGALVAHAVRHLQGEEVARLLLEVEAANRAAMHLYRSMGFRQVAVRRGYYSSGGSRLETDSAGVPEPGGADAGDALVMALDLR
jgi:[ribosomal protein S18]-alanine N-acetyltransferase